MPVRGSAELWFWIQTWNDTLERDAARWMLDDQPPKTRLTSSRSLIGSSVTGARRSGEEELEGALSQGVDQETVRPEQAATAEVVPAVGDRPDERAGPPSVSSRSAAAQRRAVLVVFAWSAHA
jgi:hypothetical protein